MIYYRSLTRCRRHRGRYINHSLLSKQLYTFVVTEYGHKLYKYYIIIYCTCREQTKKNDVQFQYYF